MLLLYNKYTDTLIEQAKTKPQETLELETTKQMKTFSFNPPINLVEEGKWLLAVTSFGTRNSDFNITNESNSISITMPGHWQTKSAEKTIGELINLLELRSQKGIDLHVENVGNRGNKTKIEGNEYKFTDFDTKKKTRYLKNLKNVKYNDLEDLVYRFQLTFDEIIDKLDLIFTPIERIASSLPSSIYENFDTNKTLEHILPDIKKVINTNDGIRLKSKLRINQTLFFTKKIFFHTILGFTQSQSYPSNDVDEFYQLMKRKWKIQ